MNALEYLRDLHLNFNIALVSIRGNRQELFKRLQEMNLGRIMMEEEEIKLYPLVRKRLEKEKLLQYFEEKERFSR